MTTLTRDLLSAYGIALTQEVLIGAAATGDPERDERWLKAKARVAETRARLIDRLERLEEKAMAEKGPK
jgi:hypothetical protein